MVIIISLTVITFLISTIYFNSETKLSVENILIGVAILLGVFVAIVFTMNKNLTRLVEMRTKELEKQRDNLEISC